MAFGASAFMLAVAALIAVVAAVFCFLIWGKLEDSQKKTAAMKTYVIGSGVICVLIVLLNVGAIMTASSQPIAQSTTTVRQSRM